jgi:hypothetical protein
MKKTTFSRIKVCALLAASLLVFDSCINNSVDEDSAASLQEKIGFTAGISAASSDWAETKSNVLDTDVDSTCILETVSSNETVDTKGSIVSAVSTYGSFGTFSYVYSGTSSWSNVKGSATPDFMYNLKSESISGQWRPNDKLYYWPAATYKLSFFAYSPYTDYKVNGTTPVSDYLKISGKTSTGAPVITYSVPSKVSDQIDLMTASATDIAGNYHKPVPMNFQHALAGIRFNAKTAGKAIVIKKVTIANVYDNGTYAIGDASWTIGSTKSSFAFNTDLSIAGTSTAINDPTDSLFFMVPQTLPANAKLIVDYVFAGKETTATADFSGKSWEMGKIYTYNLTINASAIYYEFSVTLANNDVANNKATYNVVSRLVNDNGSGTMTYTAVDYAVSGLPSGATYVKNNDGTLTVNGPSRSGAEQKVISNSSAVMRYVMDSLTGPVDLTTGSNYSSGTRGETANCYVLNQAGYFCFPADVMGNGASGIVPTEDPTSYMGVSNESELLRTNGLFSDYSGNLLTTSASLNTSGCKAVLLWEDVKGLVNNLQLNTVGAGYISFKTMARSQMTPGNAVIALEASDGTIMWSWHIWCTTAPGNYSFKSPFSGSDTTMTLSGVKMAGDDGIAFTTAQFSYTTYLNLTSKSYTTKIMQVNLGTVERDRYYYFYPARSFSFTCTQAVTGEAKSMTLNQPKAAIGVSPIGYTNTLYQWGRKDPFISGDISTAADNTNSTYYNSKYASGTNTFKTSVSNSNESTGVFGIYGTQSNSEAEYEEGGHWEGWKWVSDNSWNVADYSVNLTFAIQHPMTMVVNKGGQIHNYNTDASWFSYHNDMSSGYDTLTVLVKNRYDNPKLWGGGYTRHPFQASSVKTIYDPSPAGYKVPVAYCYEGFLSASGAFEYGNHTSNGLFFPATGVRNSKTGKLQQMGVRGDFWCSSMKYRYGSIDNGCFVKNASGEFGHDNTASSDMSRANAMSIRPVGEDY